MANQDGLEWIWRWSGPEPRWTKQPDIKVIESITRQHLKLDSSARCTVKYFAEGDFNKLFKIETDYGIFIFRVALPVDPGFKTRSEVATPGYVSRFTTLPIAKVFAFDASNSNELGFEWILMEFMGGKTLRERWRKMPFEAKQALMNRVFDFQLQLLNQAAETIGNLYISNDSPGQEPIGTDGHSTFKIDRIVSPDFFSGYNLKHDVNRGPYKASFHWFKARLSVLQKEQDDLAQRADDDDARDEARAIQRLAFKIEEVVDEVLSPDESDFEATALFHDDLSWRNIIVDDEETINAIIDWESVSVLPIWKACQMPAFLESRDRHEEPKRDNYLPHKQDDELETDGINEETPLDNEGVDELYWDHLCDYELTSLRKLHRTKMDGLKLPGMPSPEKRALLVDIDMAIEHCRDVFFYDRIYDWIDALNGGNEFSLATESRKIR